MNTIQVYEHSSGKCVQCGKAFDWSMYWTPLSDEEWQVLRPVVTHMFPPGMVQNVLFIPPFNKPLCGAQCSNDYQQEKKDAKV